MRTPRTSPNVNIRAGQFQKLGELELRPAPSVRVLSTDFGVQHAFTMVGLGQLS